MKPTALDPQTALVLIDLQKEITRLPTIQPTELVVANASRLAAAFPRIRPSGRARSRGLLGR